MVAYNKFEQTIGDIFEGVLTFGTDTFRISLFNSTPVATDTDLNTSLSPDQLVGSAVNEIVAGNGYTEGGAAVTITTSAEAGGTYTFAGNQVVFTAAGGAISQFRYFMLWSDSAGAAATRPIIAWWDHGSAVDLNDGDTFTIQFSGTDPGNIFTAA